MKLIWFSGALLGVFLLFSIFSDDSAPPRALSADEQALQKAMQTPAAPASAPTTAAAPVASPAGESQAFKRQVGEPRRYPVSARLDTDVIEDVCSTSSNRTEQDLIGLFGEPSQRLGSAQDGFLSLLWNHDDFGVQALFDEDIRLRSMTGYVRGTGVIKGDKRLPRPDFSALAAMEHPSLAQVSELLGPGVLTGADWQRGIDVAASLAPKMREDIRQDHCDMIYRWLVPGFKEPVSLTFNSRERLVDNVFVRLARKS